MGGGRKTALSLSTVTISVHPTNTTPYTFADETSIERTGTQNVNATRSLCVSTVATEFLTSGVYISLIYSILVYLMTLSTAQIILRPVIELSVNNELENVWKGAAV